MKILFVRANLSRKPKYQVGVLIYQGGRGKCVRKYLIRTRAQTHLQSLDKKRDIIAETLPKDVLLPEILAIEKAYIDFEYINLPTLELLIEKTILNHSFKSSKEYLIIFKKLLDKLSQIEIDPYKNEQFVKRFDPLKRYQKNIKETCLKSGILDLNLDNILFNAKNKKKYLIDWEWVFNFPIPKEFILFRSLFYLSNKLQSLITTFCCADFPCYEIFNSFYIPKVWFDLFSFTSHDIEKFLFYESNFQNSVNNIKIDPNRIKIFKEKNLLTSRISANLNSYIQNEFLKNQRLQNQINHLDTQLQQKDAQLQQKDAQLQQKNAQLQQKDVQLTNLTNQLNNIYNSLWWKLGWAIKNPRKFIIKYGKKIIWAITNPKNYA